MILILAVSGEVAVIPRLMFLSILPFPVEIIYKKVASIHFSNIITRN